MNDSKIIAIIQARMSSSRLPGKVLKPLGNSTVLGYTITRTKRSRLIDQVVVATTSDPSDDDIATYCQIHGYPFFRGNLYDVLDRYYQAALFFQADTIVRITADCPFIDPNLIDEVIETFQKEKVDFAANRLPPPEKRTYPIGLDTEVCSFTALQKAWKQATAKFEREHVMPYLYGQEGCFKTKILQYTHDYGSMRWTVDTPEDLVLVQEIARFFKNRTDFGWLDIIKLFEQYPSLAQINAKVQHKSGTDVDARVK